MKNIVFIPNIDLGNGRNTPYHYSIKSWKKWCDANNVEFIEWTDPITDVSQFKVTLQRYWVHDILNENNIEYEQVLIADADTIIHPNTPNFFDETDGKFGVVLNNGVMLCFQLNLKLSLGSISMVDFKSQINHIYHFIKKFKNTIGIILKPSICGTIRLRQVLTKPLSTTLQNYIRLM